MHDDNAGRGAEAHGEASRAAPGGDALGSNSEIGRKLREYYQDLVSDAVPDRFAQLLSQLERAEQNNGKG